MADFSSVIAEIGRKLPNNSSQLITPERVRDAFSMALNGVNYRKSDPVSVEENTTSKLIDIKVGGVTIGSVPSSSSLGLYHDIGIRAAHTTLAQMTKATNSFTIGIWGDTSFSNYLTSSEIAINKSPKVNYYYRPWDTLSDAFDIIRFYDASRNIIGSVKGKDSTPNIIDGKVYDLVIPNNAVYMRYTTRSDEGNEKYGILVAEASSLDDALSFNKGFGSRVLWLGTSIPEGATYPSYVAAELGVQVTNNSLGASFMVFDPTPVSTAHYEWEGRCLSATKAELRTKYQPSVAAGNLTQAQLESIVLSSYEERLVPYLSNIDVVIFDHGFNDRDNIKTIYDAGKENIYWGSTDRSNYIGAFNYLRSIILSANPHIQIFVGGYFQSGDYLYGKEICEVNKWIAEHYQYPFLDVHNYTGASIEYVPNSSNYLANFNRTYGTSYQPALTDPSGNILAFQIFCPDGVHPHTDLTGNANKILNRVFVKILQGLI